MSTPHTTNKPPLILQPFLMHNTGARRQEDSSSQHVCCEVEGTPTRLPLGDKCSPGLQEQARLAWSGGHLLLENPRLLGV